MPGITMGCTYSMRSCAACEDAVARGSVTTYVDGFRIYCGTNRLQSCRSCGNVYYHHSPNYVQLSFDYRVGGSYSSQAECEDLCNRTPNCYGFA